LEQTSAYGLDIVTVATSMLNISAGAAVVVGAALVEALVVVVCDVVVGALVVGAWVVVVGSFVVVVGSFVVVVGSFVVVVGSFVVVVGSAVVVVAYSHSRTQVNAPLGGMHGAHFASEVVLQGTKYVPASHSGLEHARQSLSA